MPALVAAGEEERVEVMRPSKCCTVADATMRSKQAVSNASSPCITTFSTPEDACVDFCLVELWSEDGKVQQLVCLFQLQSSDWA